MANKSTRIFSRCSWRSARGLVIHDLFVLFLLICQRSRQSHWCNRHRLVSLCSLRSSHYDLILAQCCLTRTPKARTLVSGLDNLCGLKYVLKPVLIWHNSLSRQAVGFEAPAAETRLVIPSNSRDNEEIHIGLSWSEGLGKYKLTKVITLAPRFMIRNDTTEAISYREHGSTPRDRGVLEPGERTPLHFMKSEDTKLLTLALSGLNVQWYVSWSIYNAGTEDRVGLHQLTWRISGPSISV